MKINVLFTILLLGTLLTACLPSQKVLVGNFQVHGKPPNGIKVAENLFCDQTEISNHNWREFLYWNKHIFGEQSIEYTSLIPDTLVGAGADSCLHTFMQSYWRDPAYNNFPVVGITQEQATRFSDWRADRFFEALLIVHKIIKYDDIQNRDKYFTIARYYKGELDNVISNDPVPYYPEFRLPNLDERRSILAYSDSLDLAYFDKCRSSYCAGCKAEFPEMRSNVTPCGANTFDAAPTRNVRTHCSLEKGDALFNLRGNVAEWTSEAHIAAGGSWKDSKQQILASDTIAVAGQNAWTGFRNVCVWKKWGE